MQSRSTTSGEAANPLVQTIRLPTTEPESIVEGRPVLYDAAATSGNGEASCASCHIFGDFDSLAWNLGNPDDPTTANPPAASATPAWNRAGFPSDERADDDPDAPGTLDPWWHALRRGDRTNGFFNPTPSPCLVATEGDCDEQISFDNFIVAFERADRPTRG